MRAWTIFSCVILGLIIGTPASGQQRDRDWDDCASKNDPDRGIRGCTAVLNRGNRETAKNRAIALTNRGMAHGTRRNLDAALTDYNEAIRLDPRYVPALSSRSEVHRQRGNLDAAMADLNEAIRLNPRYAFALSSRGNLHRQRGNLDAAMADLNEAIRVNPQYAFAFSSRGNLHRQRGNLDAAMADYNEAIRLDPRNATAYNSRAYARLDRQDFAGALADVELAIQLRPIAQYFDSRGDVNKARGDLKAAMADYTEAIRLEPRNAVSLHNRGLLNRQRGNPAAAEEDLRAAVAAGRAQAQADLDDLRRSLAAAQPSPPQVVATVATGRPMDPAPSAAALPPERRVALVIGNAAYRASGVAALPNPSRDARSMAALFRELGFQQVTLHEDLDQAGMLRALRDFEREAERADWAVVYFAGHGIEIGGTNHLIPVDAQLRSDRDIPDEAVPLSRVLSRLEGAKKLRLVILDACRDNPFVPRMQRVASRSVTRGLAPIDDNQLAAGTMVAYAARAGQVAEDGTGENSPFVQALTRRMKEPNVEINRKRSHEARLPFQGLTVLGGSEHWGFELSLWMTLTMTRRALAIGGSRF